MTAPEVVAGEALPLVLLSGGGGGAKLAGALSAVVTDRPVIVVTNTGDDFEHLGLLICPDTDSVMYAASGNIDAQKGWGRAGESWEVFDTLSSLGGPSWFQLGDKDLGLHLARSDLLAQGASLAQVTAQLAGRLAVPATVTVVPATEQPVRTRVHTADGELGFQEYFVKHRCEPVLTGIDYRGIEQAQPTASLVVLLEQYGEGGFDVVLGPSNPFLSLAPILDIPQMTEALRQRARHVMAVSPIIGGKALKGPAAKIMTELGLNVSAQGWVEWMCQRYPDLVDTWVCDEADRALFAEGAVADLDVRLTQTVMSTPQRSQAFAQWLLEVTGDNA